MIKKMKFKFRATDNDYIPEDDSSNPNVVSAKFLYIEETENETSTDTKEHEIIDEMYNFLDLPTLNNFPQFNAEQNNKNSSEIDEVEREKLNNDDDVILRIYSQNTINSSNADETPNRDSQGGNFVITDSLEGAPKLRRSLSRSRSVSLRKKVERLMIDDINQAIESVADVERNSLNINQPTICIERPNNESQSLLSASPKYRHFAPFALQHAISDSNIKNKNDYEHEESMHEPGSLFHSQSVDDLLRHDIDGLKKTMRGSIRYKRNNRNSLNFNEDTVYENLLPTTPPPNFNDKDKLQIFLKTSGKKPLPLPRTRSLKDIKKVSESKKVVYVLDKEKDHFVLESNGIEQAVAEPQIIVTDTPKLRPKKELNSDIVQLRHNLRPVSLYNPNAKMKFVLEKNERPVTVYKGCKFLYKCFKRRKVLSALLFQFSKYFEYFFFVCSLHDFVPLASFCIYIAYFINR